ncbi:MULTISPECIES: tripartite tricarboxylate transporter permease [Neobacillus]|uniref:Tripartite tricarboxylate transporter permease n=1 Tax=Neobacillus citreus TaxID=2833578 RepID=A0A942T5I9_9BACI|nr:tripartite tricarboxylate transporter permease [Neobacillus citreus]MCH6264235.1 tripartite tricarboxylate transporter permease [Neobacillus citreus]
MGILDFDFSSLFTLTNMVVIIIGTIVGLVIGALPGLGATIAIVFLLPFTYSMSPVAAVLLLLSAYQAAEYGGSISSITLGIPGTPAAAATLEDGVPLARKKSPGKALGYSLTASTIGGIFGALCLIFLTEPIANFALKLSDPEFVLLGIMGLIAVASISTRGTMTKSLISVVLGLMAGTIGMDMFVGSPRFTMGQLDLMEGLGIVALLIGLFAIPEILRVVKDELHIKFASNSSNLSTKLELKEIKSVAKPIGIGSVIGTIAGILPGLGTVAASWFSYIGAKKVSKSPETFGKGNPEGIAAPESANNASVGGALIPLFALGIPGSVGIAIVMGAFIIHGIQPGPRIFAKDPTLTYGILFGFLLTTVSMYIIGRLLTPLFARMLVVPNSFLMPIVLVIALVGGFSASTKYFDLWFSLILGVLSFIFIMGRFSMAAFVMAYVLSPIIEKSLRRTLLLTEGSYSAFVTRPASLVLLLIIILMLISPLFSKIKNRRKESKLAEDSTAAAVKG